MQRSVEAGKKLSGQVAKLKEQEALQHSLNQKQTLIIQNLQDRLQATVVKG